MEDNICNSIDELIRGNFREDSEVIRNAFIEIVENAKREAFMDGYKYAIKVLENGLIKKEKTK